MNTQIEFPSALLPPQISSGSIVDITVARNHDAESASQKAFADLQSSILSKYGMKTPTAPILRQRNATQTSIVLEWDPINLATAQLKSLSLYRNGGKAGTIPRPKEMLSTKISGLQIDTEYTFHLVLRTSAGTFTSEKVVCRTQKMTDLTGITVTPGVLPASLRDSLQTTVERIGAKIVDTVRIDTTHFVCTEGRGPAWEKAVEMNIPVVRPEWVDGCEREGRIVGVRQYYLNADPKLRQIGQTSISTTQQQSSQNLPIRTSDQPSVEEAQAVAAIAAASDAQQQGSEDRPPQPPQKDDKDGDEESIGGPPASSSGESEGEDVDDTVLHDPQYGDKGGSDDSESEESEDEQEGEVKEDAPTPTFERNQSMGEMDDVAL